MKVEHNIQDPRSPASHSSLEAGKSQSPDTIRSRTLKLRETSKNMEAIFITHIFKAMEKTISKSSLAGSGNTMSSMMFSSVMGEALSERGGLGLADVIFRSLAEKEGLSVDELGENPEPPLTTRPIPYRKVHP